MNDIMLLMILPFAIACVLLVVKSDRLRGAVSEIGAAGVMMVSILVAANHLGSPRSFVISNEMIDLAMFAVEAILGIAVIVLGIRFGKYIVSVLGTIQLVLTALFEFVFKEGIEVEHGLYIDDLSIIMVLIIGIVGSLICVYAVGYMRDFQREHSDSEDPGSSSCCSCF